MSELYGSSRQKVMSYVSQYKCFALLRREIPSVSARRLVDIITALPTHPHPDLNYTTDWNSEQEGRPIN